MLTRPLIDPSNVESAPPETGVDADPSTQPSGHTPGTKRRWLVGFLISTVIIWAITPAFLSSLWIFEWDPQLKGYVLGEGSVYHQRYEGYATTRYGKHGVAAIPDITKIAGPKVALWGDSFVEAKEVPDEKKMAQQVTKLWNAGHEKTLTAFGFGRGYFTVADIHHFMPKFEEIAAPIRHHFIFINRIEKTLPDRHNPRGAKFVSTPEFAFLPPPEDEIDYSVLEFLARFNLQFATRARTTVMTKIHDSRFHLGPVHPSHLAEPAPEPSPEAQKLAWDFLFAQFKAVSSAPITFVYLPEMPYVKNGAIIYEDDERHLADRFAEHCRKNDIGFINLEKKFADFTRETGRFPRGFVNSHPWKGHLNTDGHRIVAQELLAVLEQEQNAL